MGNGNSTFPPITVSDLKAGDLVKIRMNLERFGIIPKLEIEHVGVYVGNQQIVHNKPGTGRMNITGGKVELCSFDKFLKLSSDGNRWERISNAYLNQLKLYKERGERRFSGDETAERAISRVGEENFHLRNNNSEHFAMECRLGMHSSSQFTNALFGIFSWRSRPDAYLELALAFST